METDRKVHFQKKKKKKKEKGKKVESESLKCSYWSTSSVMACVILMLSTLHVVEKRILLHPCFGR